MGAGDKTLPAEAAFPLRQVLPISLAHLRVLDSLPLHHRDPFDRLLIAQSLAERIPIITGDRAFAGYSVAIVW